jgi:hypothetical protein
MLAWMMAAWTLGFRRIVQWGDCYFRVGDKVTCPRMDADEMDAHRVRGDLHCRDSGLCLCPRICPEMWGARFLRVRLKDAV